MGFIFNFIKNVLGFIIGLIFKLVAVIVSFFSLLILGIGLTILKWVLTILILY